MDPNLKTYLLEQCRNKMTPQERTILNRLSLTQYGNITSRMLSIYHPRIELEYRFRNDKINKQVALGKDLAEKNIALRILKDHPEVINNCPQCNQLARTPKAKQCRHCFYTWYS